MEFKIDTKAQHLLITPAGGPLSVNMAARMEAQLAQLAETGSGHALIDLSHCQSAEEGIFEHLALWHERAYATGHSLVFANPSQAFLQAARDAQMEGAINLAPTLAEGLDIISMEIIERELFDEES
ncbi:MAG: STAS domain-containing protein [Bacteroidetes bacterium]|nr:STAS domain-containing protein [Bacteroidota bacterium]